MGRAEQTLAGLARFQSRPCECRQQRARQEADAEACLCVRVGVDWGMCMRPTRGKQDPEAGVGAGAEGMAAEGSKGLARLFCSSAGGGEGRLNLGEKGTVEWYRGHPPTATGTRKRPHVFWGHGHGPAGVGKENGQVIYLACSVPCCATGPTAERPARTRTEAGGEWSRQGCRPWTGGTAVRTRRGPCPLSPGQRQGGLGRVSVASNPGTFRGLSFVKIRIDDHDWTPSASMWQRTMPEERTENRTKTRRTLLLPRASGTVGMGAG